jgi:hypothetical protein
MAKSEKKHTNNGRQSTTQKTKLNIEKLMSIICHNYLQRTGMSIICRNYLQRTGNEYDMSLLLTKDGYEYNMSQLLRC